jgi:Mrp family chromosome partitioning ATPase
LEGSLERGDELFDLKILGLIENGRAFCCQKSKYNYFITNLMADTRPFQ